MMRIVKLQDTPAMPWRNGGGTTQELLAWPNADDWLCRISVARIDRSGPFSAFAGVQRWFAVLQGQGVRLTLAGQPVELGSHSEPLCFDGESAPGCELLAGPTLDLNLMAQRRAGSAGMLRALPGEVWHCAAPLRALFTLDTTVLCIDDQVPLSLPAGSLAFDDGCTGGQAWSLQAAQAPAQAWWLSFTANTA